MDYPWTYTHKYPGRNNPWVVIKAGSKDELMFRIRELFADEGEDPNSIAPGVSLDELIEIANNPERQAELTEEGVPVAQAQQAQGNESDMPMVDDGSSDQFFQWIEQAPTVESLDKIWEMYQSKLTQQHLNAMSARHNTLTKGE